MQRCCPAIGGVYGLEVPLCGRWVHDWGGREKDRVHSWLRVPPHGVLSVPPWPAGHAHTDPRKTLPRQHCHRAVVEVALGWLSCWGCAVQREVAGRGVCIFTFFLFLVFTEFVLQRDNYAQVHLLLLFLPSASRASFSLLANSMALGCTAGAANPSTSFSS